MLFHLLLHTQNEMVLDPMAVSVFVYASLKQQESDEGGCQ